MLELRACGREKAQPLTTLPPTLSSALTLIGPTQIESSQQGCAGGAVCCGQHLRHRTGQRRQRIDLGVGRSKQRITRYKDFVHFVYLIFSPEHCLSHLECSIICMNK